MSRDQFDTGAAAIVAVAVDLLPPSVVAQLGSAPLLHLPAVATTAASVVLNPPMKTLGSAVKLEARKLGGRGARATFSASRQHGNMTRL